MCLGRVGYRHHLNLCAEFKVVQLVLQHVEAHLQVLGVYHVEQWCARCGGTIQGGFYSAHGTCHRRCDGAVCQLVFKLLQRCLCSVVAAVYSGLALYVVRSLLQLVSLVSLSHQYGLILILGVLQLSLAAHYLVVKRGLTQSYHHLTLLQPLSQLQVEGHYLFVDATVHRHLGNSLDRALARESVGIYCLLQTPRCGRLGACCHRVFRSGFLIIVGSVASCILTGRKCKQQYTS